MKGFPREILVSGRFGAGWASWCSNTAAAQFAAEYQPLINFIKKHGNPHDVKSWGIQPKNKKLSQQFDKLVEQCVQEIKEKFNYDFYDGGACGLYVKTIHGPYLIEDYDGAESIKEQDDADIWFY